jgi:hypothetical protein
VLIQAQLPINRRSLVSQIRRVCDSIHRRPSSNVRSEKQSCEPGRRVAAEVGNRARDPAHSTTGRPHGPARQSGGREIRDPPHGFRLVRRFFWSRWNSPIHRLFLLHHGQTTMQNGVPEQPIITAETPPGPGPQSAGKRGLLWGCRRHVSATHGERDKVPVAGLIDWPLGRYRHTRDLIKNF